jgi:microcystin-dependent protein
MKPIIIAVIVAASLPVWFASPARASDLVAYQGKLTDPAGTALPDGQYWLGARIWDLATGGTTPLWARKYQVPVSGGSFSMMLGATGTAWNSPEPLTPSLKLATAGTNRWVEITVMSDANAAEKAEVNWKVLLPRQSLTSVPFAHNGVPAGTVVPFAGSTVPDGWLLCDGLTCLDGADPRYAGLFAAIGITYGAGSGSQFKVPDMRGRVPAGRDDMGGPNASRLNTGVGAPTFSAATTTLGAAGGVDRFTLTQGQLPQHNHDKGTYAISGGSHGHPGSYLPRATGAGGGAVLAFYSAANANGEYPSTSDGSVAVAQSTHSHPNGEWSGSSGFAGSSQAHPTVQPTIILNYIIKL